MTTILIVLVIALVGGIVGVFLYQQYKNKQAVEGKMWCTLLTSAGQREEVLLPLVGNQVFLYDAKKDSNSAYVFRPDKTWNALYPPFRSKFFQVTVKSAIWMKDNPEPLPWKDDDPAITPEVLGNLQDAQIAELVRKQAQDLTEGAQFKIPLIFWLALGGLATLSAVSLVMLFQIMTGIGI